MSYRKTDKETIAEQNQFKKRYPPFRPFRLSNCDNTHIGEMFQRAMSTQNGQDTDDYAVTDGNDKVQQYLSSLRHGSKVLILGTGTGREVLSALDLGFDAFGTTLGSRNIDFGHQTLGIETHRLLEVANEALPFQPDTFDCIAGFQVFEHTIAPSIFLLEQGRVLKSNGKLLLEWPPAEGFTMGNNPHHQICFTPGQAKALLEKCGFIGVKLSYNDGTDIPESEYWKGSQNKMLVVEGQKGPAHHEYLRQAWNRSI